jgi:hypothetical protein
MKRKILLGLLIFLVLIQFIQPPQNNGPLIAVSDVSHVINTPPEVMNILHKSCYDCHSDHTEYPWYSKITPVNWWLNSHINDGKRGLNFSKFSTFTHRRQNKKLDETAELVEKHAMPLNSYLWIHKDAKLSDEQIKTIIAWAKAGQEQVMQDSLKTTVMH